MKKLILILITTNLLLISSSFAQKNINVEFPRMGSYMWRGGFTSERIAHYKLWVRWLCDSTDLAYWNVKTDSTIVISTEDWRYGGLLRSSVGPSVDAMRLKNADGTSIMLEDPQYWMDFTHDCPPYTGTVTGGGEAQPGWVTYTLTAENSRNALGRLLATYVNPAVWDGTGTDGYWEYAPWIRTRYPNLDMNRDGVADYTELGNSIANVKARWDKENYDMVDTIYNAFSRWGRWGSNGKNTVLRANMNTWNTQDTTFLSNRNGVNWEDMWSNSPETVSDWISSYRGRWDSLARAPRYSLAVLQMDGDKGNAYLGLPQNNPRYFVWNMTILQTLSNWFLCPTVSVYCGTPLFDEEYVRLGHPVSAHQYQGVTVKGCYVRFFENGCMINNPNLLSVTILSSDLSGLTGYTGPYYRFYGGQRPDWNNGVSLSSSSVTLTSRTTITGGDFGGSSMTMGDGILLVNSPEQIILAPIIVDNISYSNAVMNDTTVFSGSWSSSYALRQGHHWSIFRGDIDGSYHGHNAARAHHILGSNTETAVATYYPRVGVNADYDIYEWHGFLGTNSASYLQSTHTPVIVTHIAGVETVYVDQSINFGQWNYLCTVKLQDTYQATIKVSNKNSQVNKYVIADAFKSVIAVAQPEPPPVEPTYHKKLLIRD